MTGSGRRATESIPWSAELALVRAKSELAFLEPNLVGDSGETHTQKGLKDLLFLPSTIPLILALKIPLDIEMSSQITTTVW